MAKTDLIDRRDIAAAIALLTRIPLRADFSRGAKAAWAWPIAGAVVGLAAACGAWVLEAAGLPPILIAGLALLVQTILTGALHEDGLADTVDGLWGGHDPARRLEIMKDSAIGSYGVLALVFGAGLRWFALAAVLHAYDAPWILVPLAMLSRAPMAVLSAALPNARGGGLSSSVGRASGLSAAIGVALAAGLALLTTGGLFLAPMLWIAFGTIALAALARAKIGGQTGDILGASQQLAETLALLALAAQLP